MARICGISPQIVVKVLAILQGVLFVVLIIATIVIISFSPTRIFGGVPASVPDEVVAPLDAVFIRIGLAIILFIFPQLVLAVVLFLATSKVNSERCRLWMNVNIVLFINEYGLMLGCLNLYPISCVPFYVINVYLLFHFLMLCCVFNLIGDIKRASSSVTSISTVHVQY